MVAIYHLTTGSIAWSYAEQHTAGDVLVNPPEYVVERYADNLDRLDDGEGNVPTSVLRKLPYTTLREIAADADHPDIDGNSGGDAIIGALGIDVSEETAGADELEDDSLEAKAARAVEQLDEGGTSDSDDETGPSREAIEAEKAEVRTALEERGVDVPEPESNSDADAGAGAGSDPNAEANQPGESED